MAKMRQIELQRCFSPQRRADDVLNEEKMRVKTRQTSRGKERLQKGKADFCISARAYGTVAASGEAKVGMCGMSR